MIKRQNFGSNLNQMQSDRKKLKIGLIYPNANLGTESRADYPHLISLYTRVVNMFSGDLVFSRKGGYLVPPFNLLVIAANSPKDVCISIIDERVTSIDFEKELDLVGITCITPNSHRAYEIANKFRQRGITVVLGGIHPTSMPEEAGEHADVVVIGEAEGVWTQLLEDYKKKELKKFYKNPKFLDLKDMPMPRWDLLEDGVYLTKSIVEVGRGCPNCCTFCSVSAFFGQQFRHRPIQDIIKEIEKCESKTLFLQIDNMVGNPSFAKNLFQNLIPLKISWISNSSLKIAENAKLLELAAKSGCKSLLIGFESLSRKNLRLIRKDHSDPCTYDSLIKRFHDFGIGVTATFMIGLDDDDESVFEEIREFSFRNKIESPQPGILVPYPGTTIYNEFQNNGALLTKDWSKYYNITGNVVYQPRRLTIRQLQNGYISLYNRLYSIASIVKRLLTTRNFLVYYLPFNIGQRRKALLLRRYLKNMK